MYCYMVYIYAVYDVKKTIYSMAALLCKVCIYGLTRTKPDVIAGAFLLSQRVPTTIPAGHQ
jgi:hypothetical protein